MVICRVHNYGDALMVFGRATQHRRATYVDVLDGCLKSDSSSGDSLLEGIKIYDYKVDRLNPVLADFLFVCGIAADVEQTSMDLGMERLHAPIEHFWKLRMHADVLYLQAGLPQDFRRAAGGEQLHSCGGQRLR